VATGICPTKVDDSANRSASGNSVLSSRSQAMIFLWTVKSKALHENRTY